MLDFARSLSPRTPNAPSTDVWAPFALDAIGCVIEWRHEPTEGLEPEYERELQHRMERPRPWVRHLVPTVGQRQHPEAGVADLDAIVELVADPLAHLEFSQALALELQRQLQTRDHVNCLQQFDTLLISQVGRVPAGVGQRAGFGDAAKERLNSTVGAAQFEYDRNRPDVIVGSSRGGAVAMNVTSGTTPRP